MMMVIDLKKDVDVGSFDILETKKASFPSLWKYSIPCIVITGLVMTDHVWL